MDADVLGMVRGGSSVPCPCSNRLLAPCCCGPTCKRRRVSTAPPPTPADDAAGESGTISRKGPSRPAMYPLRSGTTRAGPNNLANPGAPENDLQSVDRRAFDKF